MDTTRASLLLRIRDRADSVAWQEFDSVYRPLLHRYARACKLDDAECDDVEQYCMAAIYRHISRFDYDPDKGRFRGWLRTLVKNRVSNIVRARREHLAESQDFKRAQLREPVPDEEFDRIWMQEHLRHCLGVIRGEVDVNTFQAFRMYVIEERPVEQVCEELGINRSRLYKIKWHLTQKLQEKMNELFGDFESIE